MAGFPPTRQKFQERSRASDLSALSVATRWPRREKQTSKYSPRFITAAPGGAVWLGWEECFCRRISVAFLSSYRQPKNRFRLRPFLKKRPSSDSRSPKMGPESRPHANTSRNLLVWLPRIVPSELRATKVWTTAVQRARPDREFRHLLASHG